MDKNKQPERKLLKFFNQLRTNKKIQIGIIIYFALLLLLIVFKNFNTSQFIISLDWEKIGFKIIPVIIAAIITIIGFGHVLITYLEGNKLSDDYFTKASFDNKEIAILLNKFNEEQRQLQERRYFMSSKDNDAILKQLEELNKLRLDETQKSELFLSLKQSFSENINEDFFKQLNENISTELTKEKRTRLEFLLSDFNEIKLRLGKEIDSLSKRANLNLVIGSIVTLFAITTGLFILFQKTDPFYEWPKILYYYIPRLSLLVFVEFFAYFFLKLYKTNLNDVKYYQNELTTVQMKLAALTTAINFGKDTDISAIIIEISKIERNFILDKGKTTVEIEKSKIDLDSENSWREIFKDVLKLKQK